jgi:hypothetical protein
MNFTFPQVTRFCDYRKYPKTAPCRLVIEFEQKSGYNTMAAKSKRTTSLWPL